MTLVMPVPVRNVLDWHKANVGRIDYSQTGQDRLNPNALTTPTDCSGNIIRLYNHFAGLRLGTYTGNMENSGHLVTTSKSDVLAGRKILPGDFILFEWSYEHTGSWNHVALIADNVSQIWNNGGEPEWGPVLWNIASSVNASKNIRVVRPIPWESKPTTPPLKGTSYPLKGLRRFQFGDSGPGVTLIQKRLKKLGWFDDNAGGNYGPVTRAAVNAWKKHCGYKPDSKFGRVAWKRLMNPKNDTRDRKN